MNNTMITFRTATEDDLLQLADVFRRAVEEIGPQRYSPEQVAEWTRTTEPRRFQDFICNVTTFIAVVNQQPAGFCGIADDGYVGSLYVAPEYGRRGIGSCLLVRVIEYATMCGATAMWTEASHFSRPLFLKHGFEDTGTDSIERNGVMFSRFLMRKPLTDNIKPNPSQ